LLFSEGDGMLYATVGDGGAADNIEDNAQDLSNVMGSIIRIDVTSTPDAGKEYRIPDDNPFNNVSNARGEIWAYGLRNPWRCSFDRQNPSYFICGEVGQGALEEIDLIVKGGNYGWSKYEGTNLYQPNAVRPVKNPIFPIMQYDHSVGHSLTGGYIYRGKRDACQCGKYIFGDYQDQRYFQGVESPPLSGHYTMDSMSTVCSSQSVGCTAPGNIYSFSEDREGDLYICGGTVRN
jgi:hypothetical protein